MTKLLDEAIEKVRELPDAVQDDAAQMLFSVAAKQRGPVELDEETLAAVLEGRAQAHRGEFVSDEEMQAYFERRGIKP
jgi:predicted transcriptional regulator